MAGHALPCREDRYEIMTGASGSVRLVSYLTIILFFEIEGNSGKIFTEPRSGDVNIPKATIHRD